MIMLSLSEWWRPSTTASLWFLTCTNNRISTFDFACMRWPVRTFPISGLDLFVCEGGVRKFEKSIATNSLLCHFGPSSSMRLTVGLPLFVTNKNTLLVPGKQKSSDFQQHFG